MFESMVGHKNARNGSMSVDTDQNISVNVAYSNGRRQTLHTLQFLQTPLFPTLLKL